METFDTIIIGAGAAGCVLARRLSENPGQRVLLLESGPPDSHPYIHMPKGVAKLRTDPRYMWSYPIHRDARSADPASATEPAQHWMRGRTLGGSSSVNGMIYVRGQPQDYDDLAALTSDDWNWSHMSAAFKAIEGHDLPPTPTRGSAGPLKISAYRGDGGGGAETLMKAAIAACEALGLQRQVDVNQPDERAKVGYTMRTIHRGRRQSAAVAFLRPVQQRPNLVVRTGVLADRVLFDGARAVGVQCQEGGETTRYHGRRIIVSAGTMASPGILQRSGIGAPELLARLGIPQVASSPEVGRNLIEHTLITMQWRATSHSNNWRYQGIGALLSGLQYYATRSGPLANATLEVTGLYKINPDAQRAEGQILFGPHSFADWLKKTRRPDRHPGFMLVPFPLRPRSKGQVQITSRDPAAYPQVIFDPLADPEDRRELIAGVRFARQVAATAPLAQYALEETQPGAQVQSDEEILEALRQYGGPGFHAAGTCRMGADAHSVVDPQTRVRGVHGLHVVDLSIFPILTSGNTYVPVAALAWRAAELIAAQDGA